MDLRRWPDLPADLLRAISSHLHHAADFVSFHAVCKPWRSSHNPATSTRAQSLAAMAPCTEHEKRQRLLQPEMRLLQDNLPCQQPSSDTWSDWLGGADGSVRYFTALPHPMLHDPLVAGVFPTVLQASFPKPKGRWPDSPSGIVYSDGTILLYKSYFPTTIGGTSEFKAAILRPGDAAWIVVERTLESPDYRIISVAYHAGKILVTLDAFLWHVLNLAMAAKQDDKGDVLVQKPCVLDEHDGCWNEYSYTPRVQRRAALGASYCQQGIPRRPNSFAVDASQLDIDGGCAYFACDNYYESFQYQRMCVFRYNLVNDKAEIIEWLPQAWRSESITWLVPQPTIAPIQVPTPITLTKGQ
ncbi:hypothetical protein ACQ4PT_009464 [Festuca glaucescens]